MPARYAPAAAPTRTPCSQNPDVWWDPNQAGYAIHQCNHHCPLLDMCKQLPGQQGSVHAGQYWGRYASAHKQPTEAPCDTQPQPTVDYLRCQTCNTRPVGFGLQAYCSAECQQAGDLAAKRRHQEARHHNVTTPRETLTHCARCAEPLPAGRYRYCGRTCERQALAARRRNQRNTQAVNA